MTTIKIAIVCIGAPIFSLGLIIRARQIWRNAAPPQLDAFPVWLLRAAPSAALWMPVALMTGAVGIALSGRKPVPPPIAEQLGAIGGFALFVGFAFTVSVALSGRPRSVIPPHLRQRRP